MMDIDNHDRYYEDLWYVVVGMVLETRLLDGKGIPPGDTGVLQVLEAIIEKYCAEVAK
jgi:hypothetical protein